MDLFAIVLSAMAAIPVVMTLAPCVQALAVALLPERTAAAADKRPRVLVLTPAHDEADCIAGLVEHVRCELAPGDRHLVVADNCSDDTAALAAAAGADVLVRDDPDRRGKGHALAAGLRAAEDRGDVVIVLDADCRLGPGSLALLASVAQQLQRPVQALDIMRGGAQSKLAEFAWLLRNDLRPSGYARLGLPCQLLGTGMALPARLAAAETFDTGAVAEDLQIGLKAALDGASPVFERRAVVVSTFPVTERGALDQKRRWVHGHLDIIRRLALPTLARGLIRRDVALLAMALDILAPPLSLLAAGHAAMLVVGAAFAAATGAWLPVLISTGGTAMFAVFLMIGWARHGRGRVGLKDFAALVHHAWRVTSFGFKFLVRDRSGWVRADRSSGAP